MAGFQQHIVPSCLDILLVPKTVVGLLPQIRTFALVVIAPIGSQVVMLVVYRAKMVVVLLDVSGYKAYAGKALVVVYVHIVILMDDVDQNRTV